MSNSYLVKSLQDLIDDVTPMNFFIWKDVLYYDGYKRMVAADEVVVTQELIDLLEMDMTLEELREIILDRL